MTMHFRTLQTSIAHFMPIHLTKRIKERIKEMKYLASWHHSFEIEEIILFSSNEDSFWSGINLMTLMTSKYFAQILHCLVRTTAPGYCASFVRVSVSQCLVRSEIWNHEFNFYLPHIYVFHSRPSSFHKSFCTDFHLSRTQILILRFHIFCYNTLQMNRFRKSTIWR